MTLNKHYNPQDWEAQIYQQWEHLAAASNKNHAPTYAIILPPPNVTGVLHIGHALNHSIQDCLIRWKRMQGFNTLWLPGTDHAGIATQGVVERELAAENTTRQQLGRKKFVDRVWQWKHQYGNRIYEQMRLLGDSCDWQRQVFTLDPGVSKAVRKVFVDLYNKKLIYRGLRMVNWSCKLQSAISDLEVEHKDATGHLWHIKYPLVGKESKFLIVATTRPETLFGDTAVAVAPGDARYQHLVGQKVKLPLTDRELPIVADEAVQSDFGSGVVKITPAHDFNDHKVGVRHKLDMPCILTLDGRLKDVPNAYKNLSVLEARKLVVQHLDQQGLLHKTEKHKHSVGYCSRSGCVVEPMLSTQWFIKTQPLAGPAKAVVENGTTSFEPELWTKTYLHWLNHIEDWCISRQLWWGHQIPAWYCTEGHENVALEKPAKCSACGAADLKQDEDVLDTWFSSALWPFSTLGWPEKTPDLKNFYPTQCLVTGHDIIFFWVARMMMMGLEFCGDVPFRKVYVHGLVRDSKGQKMSKSLGNSVDPVQVIQKYGADTLRLSCLSHLMPGRDVKLGPDKLEVQRNFINKVWNAVRFSLSVLGDEESNTFTSPESTSIKIKTAATSPAKSTAPANKPENKPENINTKTTKNINMNAAELQNFITNDLDAWVVQRLNFCITQVNNALEKYRFDLACAAIYNFAWHEFCDWYLELIKDLMYSKPEHEKTGYKIFDPKISADKTFDHKMTEHEKSKNTDAPLTIEEQKQNTRQVLQWVLDQLLRLWHPFCPFVTEYMYQNLSTHGFATTCDMGKNAAQPTGSESKSNTPPSSSPDSADPVVPSFTSQNSLMLQRYPVESTELNFPEASERIDLVCEVIRVLRTWRAENKIPFTQKIKAQLECAHDQSLKILQKHKVYILKLAGLSECTVVQLQNQDQKNQDQKATATGNKVTGQPNTSMDSPKPSESPQSACSVWPVHYKNHKLKVVIPLEGVIDLNLESARIQKSLKKLGGERKGLEKRLANENFLKQAPPEVVAQLRSQLQALGQRQNILEDNLKRL